MIWLSGLAALASLLSIFKAPAKPLWFVAIGVTEWGHWLALFLFGTVWISWMLTRRAGAASGLACAAALLCLTPSFRAIAIAAECRIGFFLLLETSHRATKRMRRREKPRSTFSIFLKA